MIFVVLIIFILQIIFVVCVVKNTMAKMFILTYTVWWNVNLIASDFNLYSLYPVSNYVYWLLILNVSSYIIGYVLFNNFVCKQFDFKEQKNELHDKYNSVNNQLKVLSRSRTFVIFLVLLILILFKYFITYVNLLNELGSSQSRTLRYFVGGLFSTQAEVLFFNYVLEPMNYIIIGLISLFVVFKQFKNYTFLLLIMYLVLFTSIGSGRIALIELILFILFAIYFRVSLKSISKSDLFRIIKLSISFVILTLVVLGYTVYLTALRIGMTGFNIDLFITAINVFVEQIVVYCIGSFRALEYAITNYSSLISPQYGFLTFSGFDELFGTYFWALKQDYNITNHFIGGITNSEIFVGPNMRFNALFTCVFNFYYDLGIIGVLIFSFIYGVLSSFIMFLLSKKVNIQTFILGALFFETSILSLQKWYFQSGSIIIIVLLMIILINFKFKTKINFKTLMMFKIKLKHNW